MIMLAVSFGDFVVVSIRSTSLCGIAVYNPSSSWLESIVGSSDLWLLARHTRHSFLWLQRNRIKETTPTKIQFLTHSYSETIFILTGSHFKSSNTSLLVFERQHELGMQAVSISATGIYVASFRQVLRCISFRYKEE